MQTRFCYRCGREFRDGEECHMLYMPRIDRLAPVCRDDISCEWQRPGRAARQVVEHNMRRVEDI